MDDVAAALLQLPEEEAAEGVGRAVRDLVAFGVLEDHLPTDGGAGDGHEPDAALDLVGGGGAGAGRQGDGGEQYGETSAQGHCEDLQRGRAYRARWRLSI